MITGDTAVLCPYCKTEMEKKDEEPTICTNTYCIASRESIQSLIKTAIKRLVRLGNSNEDAENMVYEAIRAKQPKGTNGKD